MTHERHKGMLDSSSWHGLETIAEVVDVRVGEVTEEYQRYADGEERAPPELDAYVAVDVTIDGEEYQVGTMIGVPECLHGTVRAAGCGVRPYCTAWQVDASDLQAVPRCYREMVRAALIDSCHRLWREVQDMRSESGA